MTIFSKTYEQVIATHTTAFHVYDATSKVYSAIRGPRDDEADATFLAARATFAAATAVFDHAFDAEQARLNE